METTLILFPFPFPSSKLHLAGPNPKKLRKSSALRSPASPNQNEPQENSSNNGGSKETNPPTALNIRYNRARWRRRREAKQEQKNQKEEEEEEEEEEEKRSKKKKKKWEEMRVWEKALEAYLGEKGMLFWLNKLAYASIFVLVAGWILFRFVGPSLRLYQLDSPPLSPSSIFNNA